MCDFLEGNQSDELIPNEYEAWSDWKEFVDPEFEALKVHLPDTVERLTYEGQGYGPPLAGCDTCEDMKCGDNCPAPIEMDKDVPF